MQWPSPGRDWSRRTGSAIAGCSQTRACSTGSSSTCAAMPEPLRSQSPRNSFIRAFSSASSRLNASSRTVSSAKRVCSRRRASSPTRCPSRPSGRARAGAGRSSRACASAPGCRPRSDRSSPRAARSGAGPRRSGRTAPAGERARRARSARSAGFRRPASTSRCDRSGTVASCSRAVASARRALPSPGAARRSRGGGSEVAKARARQRRVLAQHQFEQRRGALGAGGAAGVGGRMLDRLVDADAGLAPGDAQEAPVVHAVEQVRGRVARAAPGVGGAAVRELGVDQARMSRAVRLDEGQHLAGLLLRRRAPLARGNARMHQRQVLPSAGSRS